MPDVAFSLTESESNMYVATACLLTQLVRNPKRRAEWGNSTKLSKKGCPLHGGIKAIPTKPARAGELANPETAPRPSTAKKPRHCTMLPWRTKGQTHKGSRASSTKTIDFNGTGPNAVTPEQFKQRSMHTTSSAEDNPNPTHAANEPTKTHVEISFQRSTFVRNSINIRDVK